MPATLGGDRFRVEGVLGQGGMGQVLAAFDTLRGRRVALKRMRSDRPGEVRRLKEEFRALADLAHLNLCALYDVHEVDGQLYLAMEYIDGTDLRSWCRPVTTLAAGADPRDESPPSTRDAPAWTRGTQGGAEHLHGADDTYAFDEPPVANAETAPSGDDPAWTRGTQGGAEHLHGADETYSLDEPPVAIVGGSAPHPATLGPTLAVDTGDVVERGDVGAASAPRPPGRVGADLARVRTTYLQLVDALEVLHASGRVHRDLKPANVMVTGEGRVVVLDFGLTTAREADPLDEGRGARRARIEGTPAYMAPERFRAAHDGPAVDWFAVGVMLYDALVDALPFVSIDQIRGLRPELIPDPRDARPDVPESLALLCVALLHPDPAQRAGAADVRATFGAERARVLPPPFRARRLVGRQGAFIALDDAGRETRRGMDALVHVVGRSGYGKSSLLAAFLRDLREEDDAFVLVGRCYERESVPYRMFDGIVETLSDLLRSHRGKRTTEEEVSAIHRLFPSLDTTLVQGERTTNPFGLAATGTISTAPGASQGQVIEIAVHALGRVLAELAEARPVVMVIDDVQWGDHDSLHVLEELLAAVERPPMLVVLASREEEAENPLVRGLDRVMEAHAEVGFDRAADLRRPATFRRVHVGPLTREDVSEIVADLPVAEGARGAAGTSVDELLADTGGSPLLVQELATLRAGEGLDAAIRLRTEALPEDARALFTTICVAGHPLQQDDAWRASVDGFAREEAVHALRVAGLVRTHGGSPLDPVEPAHDRVRETVARSTPAERRREVHARLASVLDANPRVDPAIRAAHWRDGGDPARAVVLARRAAMQAERSGAWDRVAEMLALVEACANLEGADRTALRLRRARALRAAGHCESSARAFLAVSEELWGVERADARLDAVEQYLVGGYHAEGLSQARAMLGEVGLGIPDGPVGLVASLGVERARLFFCRFDVPAGRPAALSPDDHVRLRASWSMATGLSIVDSRLAAVFSARYLRYALAARDPDAIAQGLALEAGHQASTGDHVAARALVARAEEVVRRCNDSHTPAFVQLLSGFVHYFGGNWRDAVNAYDGALAHFSETQRGASWAVSTAHLFGVWARLYAGDWRELQRRAVHLRREALTGTNRYLGHGYHIGSGVITALLTDRPDDAARSIAAAMEGWHDKAFQIQHFLELFMGAWVDLYVGTPGNTLGRMHAAWPQIQRSLLLQVADVRFRLHHARGFACVSVGGGVHAAEALKCARVIEGVQARGAAPTAAVIRAAVAFQRGDVAAASARLEDALVAFTEAEMPAFAAAAAWRLGQLAGPSGAQRCEQARHALAALGVVRPERMLEVLAPGFGAAAHGGASLGHGGVVSTLLHTPQDAPVLAGVAPHVERRGNAAQAAAEPDDGKEAERYAALASNILFSGVRRHELLELVRELEEGSAPAGTLLMRVGDVADRLILVEEGEVQVETADQVVVRRLGPGNIVGEWGVLLRQPRTATVRAATPVRYVALTAASVASYLSADHGRALAFLRGARGILSVVERSNAELGEALARSDRMRAEQAELLRLGVATIACLSGYTLLLDLIRYADVGLPTYTWLNVPITLGFGGVVAWLIHASPSPRSAFGLTTEGAGRAVKEGVLVACALASAVLVARWIPVTRDFVEPVPLVVQLVRGTLPSPGAWWTTLLLYTLVIAPTQEFIVRGVLQTSLERLSKDRRGPWIANIIANLVFATTHLVYSHTVVAAVYVFGTLMGLLSRRHVSLLAVVVAHSLAGALILWILGLPGLR